MTRRNAIWFAFLAISVLTTACALILDVEDVNYGSPALAQNADAQSDSGPGDGGPNGPGAREDGAIDGDGAPPRLDCDVDGDGFLSMKDGCGGNDCDDDDPRAHPDAGFVKDIPPDGGIGDWNCDGIVTKAYPVKVVRCDSNYCDYATESFSSDVACGRSSTFVSCVPSSGGCMLSNGVRHVQSCL